MPDEAEGTEDWLTTYADAITLLMCFFVLLLSMSDINQGKYEQMRAVIVGEVTKKEVATPFTKLEQELNQIIGYANQFNNVNVQGTKKGVSIEFTANSLFEPGSAVLKKDALVLLKQIASAVGRIPSYEYELEVQGHTDDEPIKSRYYPTNWELSAHRATNVVRYLIQEGLPADALKAVGFAETRPKVPNRDAFNMPLPENQAQNRRVVLNVERHS